MQQVIEVKGQSPEAAGNRSPLRTSSLLAPRARSLLRMSEAVMATATLANLCALHCTGANNRANLNMAAATALLPRKPPHMRNTLNMTASCRSCHREPPGTHSPPQQHTRKGERNRQTGGMEGPRLQSPPGGNTNIPAWRTASHSTIKLYNENAVHSIYNLSQVL
ncbi:hypothetical protein FKM82_000353 [Ascaphus truei]